MLKLVSPEIELICLRKVDTITMREQFYIHIIKKRRYRTLGGIKLEQRYELLPIHNRSNMTRLHWAGDVEVIKFVIDGISSEQMFTLLNIQNRSRQNYLTLCKK